MATTVDQSRRFQALAPAGYRIRPARRPDIPTLSRFIRAEAREAEGRRLDPSTVARGVHRTVVGKEATGCWVMERGRLRNGRRTDRIVASIAVFPEWSDWHARPYWWIQSLYVLPRLRGQGLARALLGFVEQAAVAAGVREVRLYVSRSNRTAARLYRRSGFRETSYRMLARPVGPPAVDSC